MSVFAVPSDRNERDRNEHDRSNRHKSRNIDDDSSSANSAAAISAAANDVARDRQQRKFRDKHHPILRAIWDIDKDEANTTEKLRKLEDVIVRQRNDPSTLCDVLDDIAGKPIAQATPLIIACFEGDPDVIRFLIEQKERADLVRMLIKRGAKVNHLDRNAMTALHKSVIHDRPECVQALMEAKADPNVIYLGDTPLSIAARHNRLRICQILLKYHDTNVNHRNDQGGTSLHFACAAIADSPECVELLLSNGARVNVVDVRRNSPAMVATFFGKSNILTTLIRAGADLTLQNNEARTALDIAKEREHEKCTAILTKYSNQNNTSHRSDEKLADDMNRMKIRK